MKTFLILTALGLLIGSYLSTSAQGVPQQIDFKVVDGIASANGLQVASDVTSFESSEEFNEAVFRVDNGETVSVGWVFWEYGFNDLTVNAVTIDQTSEVRYFPPGLVIVKKPMGDDQFDIRVYSYGTDVTYTAGGFDYGVDLVNNAISYQKHPYSVAGQPTVRFWGGHFNEGTMILVQWHSIEDGGILILRTDRLRYAGADEFGLRADQLGGEWSSKPVPYPSTETGELLFGSLLQ